jgi:hypothetical protein
MVKENGMSRTKAESEDRSQDNPFPVWKPTIGSHPATPETLNCPKKKYEIFEVIPSSNAAILQHSLQLHDLVILAWQP